MGLDVIENGQIGCFRNTTDGLETKFINRKIFANIGSNKKIRDLNSFFTGSVTKHGTKMKAAMVVQSKSLEIPYIII